MDFFPPQSKLRDKGVSSKWEGLEDGANCLYTAFSQKQGRLGHLAKTSQKHPKKWQKYYHFYTMQIRKGGDDMTDESTEQPNRKYRYTYGELEGGHLEQRMSEYLELKRKRDIPTSERKAELLNNLHNGNKKK